MLDQIFKKFSDNTKRNINKSEREGIDVKIGNSLDSMKEFYRLNCVTRQKHALPPQPYKFFGKIYEHIISRNLGLIILASYNGKNIAGALYFHFGEKAVFKYGASNDKFQNLRPNNIVMWEAIKWYAKRGYKTLCLGRTEIENEGLRRFKSGWGTREQTLSYFKYDLLQDKFVMNAGGLVLLHNKYLNKIPVPVLKVMGSLLYRHMG